MELVKVSTPPFPAEIVDAEARGKFFYFLSFFVLVLAFIFVKYIYGSRFRLILNAIRDNEDKAEAMGIQTMKYKIVGWMVSAFFCGLSWWNYGWVNWIYRLNRCCI